MDKQRKIKEEVEKTLAVFDRMERVAGNPYLATRLEERLRPTTRSGHFSWQWSLVALLLLLNVAVLVSWQRQAVAPTSLEDEIAEDYGWSTDQQTAIELYTEN